MGSNVNLGSFEVTEATVSRSVSRSSFLFSRQSKLQISFNLILLICSPLQNLQNLEPDYNSVYRYYLVNFRGSIMIIPVLDNGNLKC